MFEPINRRNKLYSEVFLRLQKLFQNGTLKAGDKLPGERDLASMLKVSRNSLREALRILEILGLIDIIPGSGTYVKKSHDDLIFPLAISLYVEQNSMTDLMEIRRIFELECVSLAAKRSNEEDLKELEVALNDMKLAENAKDWIAADIRFHYLLAKSSKNTLLLRLLLTLSENISETIATIRANRFTSKEMIQETIQEHVKIYEAIKNKNSELAKQRMEEHILHSASEAAEIEEATQKDT